MPQRKERVAKGRMILCVTLISTGQFLASQVTNVIAADQSGVASVYSHESGSATSSGQKLNAGALTAAHRTLPFGTKVKVTNKRNGRSVVVTINDRDPFVRGRIIRLDPMLLNPLITNRNRRAFGDGWRDNASKVNGR